MPGLDFVSCPSLSLVPQSPSTLTEIPTLSFLYDTTLCWIFCLILFFLPLPAISYLKLVVSAELLLNADQIKTAPETHIPVSCLTVFTHYVHIASFVMFYGILTLLTRALISLLLQTYSQLAGYHSNVEHYHKELEHEKNIRSLTESYLLTEKARLDDFIRQCKETSSHCSKALKGQGKVKYVPSPHPSLSLISTGYIPSHRSRHKVKYALSSSPSPSSIPILSHRFLLSIQWTMDALCWPTCVKTRAENSIHVTLCSLCSLCSPADIYYRSS